MPGHASATSPRPLCPVPAGLGAIKPTQGLAVMHAALSSDRHLAAAPTMLLASPLRWAALLRDRSSAAFAGFAGPPVAQTPAAPAAQVGPPPSGESLPVRRALWAAEADRQAEVQSKVLAAASELLGSAIGADQSFMEVRWDTLCLPTRCGRCLAATCAARAVTHVFLLLTPMQMQSSRCASLRCPCSDQPIVPSPPTLHCHPKRHPHHAGRPGLSGLC